VKIKIVLRSCIKIAKKDKKQPVTERLTWTDYQDPISQAEVGFCCFDICISIVVVNGVDTGKVSAIHHITSFNRFIPTTNATM